MDFGLAFTFLPNSSDNWISKFAMGVVFALLIPFFGLGGIALVGWFIAIAGRVTRGDEDVLPEWSEIVPIFINGLKAVIVIFLWFIPFWILASLNALVDQPFLNIIVSCCSLIYGIPFSILLLGVFGQLAADQPFGAVLNPMNAWRVISANWANTLIVWIVAAIGIALASIVGTILCGIGILIGIPYGYALAGHLYGQLYREATAGKAAAV